MNSLFKKFPQLEESIPHIPLGGYPTDIKPLSNLYPPSSGCNVYIKRDDLSGTFYGGNKVRKLEFLLAEARNKGVKRVITSGAAGSNHALATAIYAREAGLQCSLLLFEQPPSLSVRHNLLGDLWSGAEIHFEQNWNSLPVRIAQLRRHYKKKEGVAPFLIPPGGSSVTGTIGFVSAACELSDQIDSGSMPCPSKIFLPLGTMGTAAGLILGLRVTKPQIRVIPVRVVPSFVANREGLYKLIVSTNKFLHHHAPAFPMISISENDLYIDEHQFGDGYGIETEEARLCDLLLYQKEKIRLDGVYSGKAFAALKAYADECCSEETILFWHTKNSKNLPADFLNEDYTKLPPQFQRYFKKTS
ncbi:pyridoxal-phosphate dependent enzyme [Chitinispirillales bacterium ANBcel5]|uniref:1-aminocyclopropane-1-carboxylate deaminase/D-cysteine desulfhydrase n=1 Tax=Cellulosispirillum alkaliphilum TaxID=3039283 RepID=UPI002A4E695C|nr:pyridoxal-phosphate dependent enzyme [Chitinispirillales bacterium ANBcel5]